MAIVSYLKSVGVGGLGLRLRLNLGHQIVVVRTPIGKWISFFFKWLIHSFVRM